MCDDRLFQFRFAAPRERFQDLGSELKSSGLALLEDMLVKLWVLSFRYRHESFQIEVGQT